MYRRCVKVEKLLTVYKCLLLWVAACFFAQVNLAQCPGKDSIVARLAIIEKKESSSNTEKLRETYKLKAEFDKCKPYRDSLYASILHKIGLYEFLNNNYQSAIQYTLEAVEINTSGKKGSSAQLAIKSYFNLAYYYKSLAIFNKALVYYDSTIMVAKKFPDTTYFINDSRLYKANIFFQKGDYQQAIDESAAGINYALKKKDSLSYLAFLNQEAQSLLLKNQLIQSRSDVEKIISLAKKLKNPFQNAFQLASGYKTKGFIYARNRQFNEAESFLKQSIQTRIKTADYGQIAGDYNDLGNFYMDSIHNYKEAKKCYFDAISFAKKNEDSLRLARIFANIGLVNFQDRNLQEAGLSYNKSLSYLRVNAGPDILENLPAYRLGVISHKELVLELMSNKTNLLLKHFIKSADRKYLHACLETALLTDTLITQMRHEQMAEGSKLYWRDRTREFFTNAIEACYLAGNIERAFFFMEKSRAVLLNDELNELGAFAYLPPEQASKEQTLHINIIREQETLNSLNDSTKEYNTQEAKLLDAKDNFEQYIKFIEKNYPVYYQYKYSDEITAMPDLRKYLSANQQSFVHYFMNDTVTYILSISGDKSRFIKLSKDVFNSQLAEKYLKFCSDRTRLNQQYKEFTSLSNSIYEALFKPLQISKGRVIICPDNFLLPFESLCPDKTGENFLVSDYVFSYVYSARYLLKKYKRTKAVGDFIGFAPVSFNPAMHMPDLNPSAASIEQISKFYRSPKLFLNKEASRQNFINSISRFTIVNVYAHASSHLNGKEPMLFMADSTIPLSQLQILQNTSIRLVVLSACETNVGKNETGEGIYSLARGFAAAGVPTIAATLWKGEENAVYAVSEKFHEDIAKGRRLDEALQNAKLNLRTTGGEQNLLPYYWANMILIGNAEPINIAVDHNLRAWAITLSVILLTCVAIFLSRRKSNVGSHSNR